LSANSVILDAKRGACIEKRLAPWELRVGDFRVFYDVNASEEQVVVLAIGQKTHNTLRIGGEEIDL